MLWSDIQELVEQQIAENMEDSGYFTPKRFRLLAGTIQKEIAEYCMCYEYKATVDTTVTGTYEYLLPRNFYMPFYFNVGDSPIYQIMHEPNVTSYPSGNPSAFYIRDAYNTVGSEAVGISVQGGTYVGFYPKPTTSGDTIMAQYWATTPEYAFSITHSGAGIATSVTYTSTATTLTLSVVGGTYSGDTVITYAHASTDTVAEVAAKLNAVTGLTVQMNRNMLGSYPASFIDIRKEVDILNVNEWVFVNPMLSGYAMRILEQGVVETLKFKDRELNASGFEASKYHSMKKQYRAQHNRKYRNQRNMGIPTIGGRRSLVCGGGNLKVIIP